MDCVYDNIIYRHLSKQQIHRPFLQCCKEYTNFSLLLPIMIDKYLHANEIKIYEFAIIT